MPARQRPRRTYRRAWSAAVGSALVLAIAAAPSPAAVTSNLADPAKKEIALQLVSSAENSSLNWRGQYAYLEDIHDGRGYTGGLVGFTSGTGDMLQLVRSYTRLDHHNPLARFRPALGRADGTESHRGLGPRFVRAWKRAARDATFRSAQRRLRDRLYFDPAVALATSDGLNALGQFVYFDAAVVHGMDGLAGIRHRAMATAPTPSAGADETAYLDAFLDERDVEMRKEAAHEDVSRVESAQRRFLHEGNLDLHTPLAWSVYGDPYEILS
jgi:chitosanase